MLGIIKKNFKHLTIPTFILIYKSMVRSHVVWAPYKKGDIEALAKVQKRATKILPTLRHLTYYLFITPLEQHIIRQSYKTHDKDTIKSLQICTQRCHKHVRDCNSYIVPGWSRSNAIFTVQKHVIRRYSRQTHQSSEYHILTHRIFTIKQQLTLVNHIYTVSQKNTPNIFSCNLNEHFLISIIFGTNIT